MENYVGSICPLCKAVITENDEITVCPSCAVPHHKSCWDENRGCTTVGCPEQANLAQDTEPTVVCKKCGSVLSDAQDFCPKCGTSKNISLKNVCVKCGTELAEGQEFCHKCGQKAETAVDDNVGSAVFQVNSKKKQNKKISKKKLIIIIAVSVAALALVGAGIFFIPKIFASVDNLCAKGNYIEAYEKAEGYKKEKVKVESIAAELSANYVDRKAPSSFNLRDVYYNKTENEEMLVLYVSGKNGYGGIGVNWVIYHRKNGIEWEFLNDSLDLSLEEFNDYDADDTLEYTEIKFIKAVMENERSIKLDKEAVDRINDLFKAGDLDEIKPIK